MNKRTLLLVWATWVVVAASAADWWDDFPRMVDCYSVSDFTNYHGSFAMNNAGRDPSWGIFFQQDDIVVHAAETAAFADAGIKQIGYFETYGTTASVVTELGAWDGVNATPVLHHHWNWQDYAGGTIRWVGAKDFFDNEDYARPYTRIHSRYGGLPMTYPDGSEATGYIGGDAFDPRNSRVYDASCAKDVLGNLFVTTYANTSGETDGLFYISEKNYYTGFMDFGKDTACLNWTNYVYASILQGAEAGGDGMWTDNYGPWDSFGREPIDHAFGDWSVARFRDYLSANFTAGELSAMGVSNVATFDIRVYLRSVASGWASWGTDLKHSVWNDPRWLNDDLWRAYTIYKRQIGTEALSNYYNTVKAAALEGGKPDFLVAGNDIPGLALGWARGDLDMVSTEMSMGWSLSGGETGITAPPIGRYAPFYKLAREHAKSRFVNVWLYNEGVADNAGLADYKEILSHAEMLNVMYYEMLATHTFPKFAPGQDHVAGDLATDSAFFGFVEQAAPVFGNRVPVEDVGLYYSSSSLLRQFKPAGYNHEIQSHQFAFWGWGTALGELHYQYRAVPEWKLTADLLATLRVLIIPNADVFDPADVTLLQTWIDGGGRLIITGDTGKYLPESGNFELNSGGLAINSLLSHANVEYIFSNIGLDYFNAYENRPASLSQFATAMNNALSGAAPAGVTSTTASSRTGITLYEDAALERFFIDVNNFDIDGSTYVVTGTGTIEIEAMLPAALRGKTLELSVVSPQATAPVVTLLAPTDSDHVKVSLSSVDYFAGIVVSSTMRQWADPAASGDWETAANWLPASVPTADHNVLWQYDDSNPVITINGSAEAATFTATPTVEHGFDNHEYGLKMENGGSLSVGGGTGTLDLWADGWWGSRLTIVNGSEVGAADIIEADLVKVRDFLLDTAGIVSGKSYFTHDSGALEVMVQIELGGAHEAGDEAVFCQSGGTVSVGHDTYGLEIGEASVVKGSYILDGGTCAISTVTFAHADSVFEFNDGTFQGGAREGVWKGTGTLQLAETGTHTFEVDAGQTMTINSTVQLTDKPGEKGTLTKTGAGTLALNALPQISGTIDLQEGVLALNYSGTNAITELSFDGGATWAASGVWGSTGSGAEHESSRLSGSGLLLVETAQVPPASWAETYFTEEEISDGLATAEQDPDGDGMNNLIEYALGGHPRVDDAAVKLPSGNIQTETMNYIYNRRRNAAALGLTYGLSHTFDLADTNGWIYVGHSWEVGNGIIDADFESATNALNISSDDTGFIRLDVSFE